MIGGAMNLSSLNPEHIEMQSCVQISHEPDLSG